MIRFILSNMKKKILITALYKSAANGGSGSFMKCIYDTLIKIDKFDVEIADSIDLKQLHGIKYDYIICSHRSILTELLKYKNKETKILCISQGWVPNEEHFITGADAYVSISREVQDFNIKNFGIDSVYIPQPIQYIKYKETNPKILNCLYIKNSASRDDTVFSEACIIAGVNFKISDRNIDIFKQIKESDFVIGLGRSALEGMTYSKPAIIADTRFYHSKQISDGLLTANSVKIASICNFSGRASNIEFTSETIASQIVFLRDNYKRLSRFSNNYIKQNNDSVKVVKQYLKLLGEHI